MMYSLQLSQRYFAPAFPNGKLAMEAVLDIASAYRSGMYVKSIYGVMELDRIVPPVPPATDPTVTAFFIDKAVLYLRNIVIPVPGPASAANNVEAPPPSFGPTLYLYKQVRLPSMVRNIFEPGEIVVPQSGLLTVGMEMGLGDIPYNYLAAGESSENGMFITIELDYQ